MRGHHRSGYGGLIKNRGLVSDFEVGRRKPERPHGKDIVHIAKTGAANMGSQLDHPRRYGTPFISGPIYNKDILILQPPTHGSVNDIRGLNLHENNVRVKFVHIGHNFIIDLGRMCRDFSVVIDSEDISKSL